jgi:hypothetical protein
VAVVGSAASAIQAVVEVAKVARALTVFQRTPNWLLPKENYEYSKLQKLLFQVGFHSLLLVFALVSVSVENVLFFFGFDLVCVVCVCFFFFVFFCIIF